ncbi:MAG: AAA-type ATPase lid domain-containing protein, partial [Polyangiales bacterium]
YYRLAVVELIVPPLDQRKEDIPALAESFARKYGEKFDVEVTLAPALVDRLVKRSWPGNVRELENTIARLVALSPGGVLDEPVPGESQPPNTDNNGPLKEQVEAFEKSLISRAMSEASGNQSEAARKLGLSRGTLIDKLKKYGL